MKKRDVDWAAYDKSLKQRGSITFWISDDVIASWKAKPTGNKGRTPDFSNMAIEACLTLRLVFKQPLRQTEGLVTSLFGVMDVTLNVPDHTTLSKRGKNLNIYDPDLIRSNEPIVVALDSTGLKVYGAGEWSETKHGLSKQRTWRKLHITADAASLEIIESDLTNKNVADPTEGERQLSQVNSPLKEVLADGAYDSKKVYETANSKGIDGKATVIIPPPKNAVVSKEFPECKTQRDELVNLINDKRKQAMFAGF